MENYYDMMREIEKQGQLSNVWERIKGEIDTFCWKILKNCDCNKIFFTGCGDSYFAGLAVRDYFWECTCADCFPMTSLEFSRYGIREVDQSSVVIAISMSGNVSRTIEAMKEAQKKQAFVIGITNSKEGLLYQMADCPLYLGLEEEEGWTPGTLTYAGTLLALYGIGAGLSKEKETRILALESVLREMESLVEKTRATAKAMGENLVFNNHQEPFYVLGAGPSFGTAKYSAAKFLEVGAVTAIGQESEEFAHQEFWVINKNCPVFILGPRDAGLGRTREVAECLRIFGCDLFVISDDPDLCALGKYSILMEKVPIEFSPLAYCVPMQLAAYYYSRKKGLDPDRRSHNDPFRKKVSRMLTRGKAVVS